MKKVIAAAFVLVVAGAATAQAGVNLHLNIGVPVAAAPMTPFEVAASYPTVPSQLVLEEPPRFIYSPNLGFYVSVGIPHDIAYIDHGYYLYRGGYWYLAPSYQGPWSLVRQRRLPPELRRHRYEQIRHFRDREYRAYVRDRGHYRGAWYRPSGGHALKRGDHRDDRGREHGRYDRGRDHRDDRSREHVRDDHRGERGERR